MGDMQDRGTDRDTDTDWRTDTAERPRVEAGARVGYAGPPPSSPPPAAPPSAPPSARRRRVVPPPVITTPAPARFPLFADEVTEAPQEEPVVPLAPAEDRPHAPRRRAAALPVAVVAAAVLAVVLGLGSWLLLRSPDTAVDESAGAATSPQGTAGSDQTQPSSSPADEPTEPPASKKPAAPTNPVSLVPGTRAQVPATAPSNEDVHGNTTTYEAANMLDGARDTAWRMGGDGSGAVLTFTLPQRSILTQVGLINGYAKTSSAGGTTFDWYAGNRRILAVEWVFDDGTTVRQQLTEGRALQKMRVDPVETRAVKLRLLDVTAPGSGPAGRNYTALSEVALVGARG